MLLVLLSLLYLAVVTQGWSPTRTRNSPGRVLIGTTTTGSLSSSSSHYDQKNKNKRSLSHLALLTVKTLRGGQQQQQQQQQQQDDLSLAQGTSSSSSSSTTAMSSVALPLTTAVTIFAKHYERLLVSHPIATKSWTAGIVFALSDFLAQRIESNNNKKSSLNYTRLLSTMAVGLFYFGPAAHYWYQWIFQILPATNLSSILLKAGLGQLIFGPCFTCVFFAVGLAQAKQFSLRNWYHKIRRDLFPAWLAGTGFWPLVDVISYSMVPPTYIPLFINFCSLIWTVYLSLLSHRATATAVGKK